MIVCTIIGILAAIAIPKFAELIRKSNEGSTKGGLGSLRSALSIYYADMEGVAPDDMASLTINGKYLSAIPKATVADYHRPNANFGSAYFSPCSVGPCAAIAPTRGWANDDGGWGYEPAPFLLIVSCQHTDTKGSVWSAY